MENTVDNLLYEPKNGYEKLSAAELAEMDAYCLRYRHFIDEAKTEREVVKQTVAMAQAHGFTMYSSEMKLKPGDGVYQVNREKGVVFAVIGEKSLSEGCRIAVAHADSPRLDVKPNPLCEMEQFGLIKTHYYGGIKKYQWTAVPLALHGVICKVDGSVKTVCIGEREEDPVFCVSDLLIHLSKDQMGKTMREGVTGENLKVLFGSRPLNGGEQEKSIKLALLHILHQQFGIEEEDFLSAELTLVPAWRSRDLGLDRSMIAAYGHDDRICAYAEFEPLLELEKPAYTAVCLIADKEEIGSIGVSGMQSRFFDDFMADLCESGGGQLRRCMRNSLCMSADVVNALDPVYSDVSDGQNCARFNYGVAVAKYTGSGGKGGCSDASAEVVARFRHIFNQGGVLWQSAELGKVDQGGGGTVAGYMANRNIDTLDVGVGLLSMHSPLEIAAKLDCYMMRRAADAFYRYD